MLHRLGGARDCSTVAHRYAELLEELGLGCVEVLGFSGDHAVVRLVEPPSIASMAEAGRVRLMGSVSVT